MKRKINAFLVTLALLIGSAVPAYASEKSVGLLGGVSTDAPAPVAGVYFGLGVLPHLRITPSIAYQFTHNSTDAFLLNIDVQSPWELTGSRFKVYPLAGVSVSRWNVESEANKRHYDRLGFNVGGGVEWKPSAMMGLKIFAEGKYAYAKRFETALVTVGIGYVF